jgi:RNA methyltransferase, TrmH family
LILTSSQSPVLKKIRKAIAQGGLTEDGLAVAEGPKLITEALLSGCRVDRVLCMEGLQIQDDFGVELTEVSEAVFREIKGTEHSQGVLALVEAPVWTLAQVDKRMILVLDSIQDPGNAGTMIRTAEAFGASAVVLLKGCVDPWNPKCLRASAGSLFRMPVVCGLSDLSELRGLAWYAASGLGGTPIDVVDWTRPSLVVVGNEGRGVRDDLASQCTAVTIPTAQVESLNAAIAAAVILYQARRPQ